jgi:hypothetical protein
MNNTQAEARYRGFLQKRNSDEAASRHYPAARGRKKCRNIVLSCGQFLILVRNQTAPSAFGLKQEGRALARASGEAPSEQPSTLERVDGHPGALHHLDRRSVLALAICMRAVGRRAPRLQRIGNKKTPVKGFMPGAQQNALWPVMQRRRCIVYPGR